MVIELYVVCVLDYALNVSVDYLMLNSGKDYKSLFSSVTACLQGENEQLFKALVNAVKVFADWIEEFVLLYSIF